MFSVRKYVSSEDRSLVCKLNVRCMDVGFEAPTGNLLRGPNFIRK